MRINVRHHDPPHVDMALCTHAREGLPKTQPRPRSAEPARAAGHGATPHPAQLLRRLAGRHQRAVRPLRRHERQLHEVDQPTACSARGARCAPARRSRAAPLPGVSCGRWRMTAVQRSARAGLTAPRQDGKRGHTAQEAAAGAGRHGPAKRLRGTAAGRGWRGRGERARARWPHLRSPGQLHALVDAAPIRGVWRRAHMMRP